MFPDGTLNDMLPFENIKSPLKDVRFAMVVCMPKSAVHPERKFAKGPPTCVGCGTSSKSTNEFLREHLSRDNVQLRVCSLTKYCLHSWAPCSSRNSIRALRKCFTLCSPWCVCMGGRKVYRDSTLALKKLYFIQSGNYTHKK